MAESLKTPQEWSSIRKKFGDGGAAEAVDYEGIHDILPPGWTMDEWLDLLKGLKARRRDQDELKQGGGRIGFADGKYGTQKDFDRFLKERKEGMREGDLDRLMEQYEQWYKRNRPQFEEVAEGGRIGMMYGGDPGFAFEYGGSWADWRDRHQHQMPAADYVDQKLPKERLPFREQDYADGGRTDFIFGGGAGLKGLIKKLRGKNKRLFPSTPKRIGHLLSRTDRSNINELKLKQLENLLEAANIDKRALAQFEKMRTMNDPGLNFLLKHAEEKNLLGLDEAQLSKYTNIDKDIMDIEMMIKNFTEQTMKRRPNQSGGVAYMLGERDDDVYGVGGSVGHPPIGSGVHAPDKTQPEHTPVQMGKANPPMMGGMHPGMRGMNANMRGMNANMRGMNPGMMRGMPMNMNANMRGMPMRGMQNNQMRSQWAADGGRIGFGKGKVVKGLAWLKKILSEPKGSLYSREKANPLGPSMFETVAGDHSRRAFLKKMALNDKRMERIRLNQLYKDTAEEVRRNPGFKFPDKAQIKKELDQIFAEVYSKHSTKHAEGGRIGFKDGMDRRTFLKLMGGVASIPIVGKYFKWAKPLTKARNIASKTVFSNAKGMPVWFPSLVKRVVREGKDITSKTATVDRQTVHSIKLPESGTPVEVTRNLVTDDVIVDIGLSKHGFSAGHLGQPIRLELKKGEWIEGAKGKKGIKTKDEFTIEEAEFTGGHPENIKFEESTLNKYGEQGSDLTEVESYARVKLDKTGKAKSRKEMSGLSSGRSHGWRTEKGKSQAMAEGRAESQAEEFDDFASGGLAHMVGE